MRVHLAADADGRLAGVLRREGVAVRHGVGELTVVVGGPEEVAAAATQGARRILVVTERVDRRVATALIDAGASGVVTSGTPEQALMPALRALEAGFLVLPEAARQAVRHPVLTARQRDIMRLVVLGLSNAEIADRLYLTESTVKTHLRAVFAKLEVRSRKEAVDVMLDDRSAMGRGVLRLVGSPEPEDGYRPPRVS